VSAHSVGITIEKYTKGCDLSIKHSQSATVTLDYGFRSAGLACAATSDREQNNVLIKVLMRGSVRKCQILKQWFLTWARSNP